MAKDKSRFKISFRVTHPTISASEIAEAFSMPVGRLFRSVGEPRRSPAGQDLGGVNKRTDVGFIIQDGGFRCDEFNVEDVILEQLEKMDLEFTAHLADTGGGSEFFIGIFPEDKNIGVQIDTAVTELLAASKIELAVDIYGADY